MELAKAILKNVCVLCFFSRFKKKDIARLRNCLEIPERYTCSQGTVVDGMEGLLITLRRLAYPNRLTDLTHVFGRTEFELSLIFNKVCS